MTDLSNDDPDLLKPPPPLALWKLYPVFFAAVYFSHLTLLRLPYFWDEGGYYIPAAWDFFRTGSLIPQTTMTNAHPPLPSILLAAWWHLSGFIPSATRTFLCMVTAAGLVAVYKLVRDLLGVAAAAAVTLLTALYPIWFAQSTLAHADMFAAAFTLWGIALYLQSESWKANRNLQIGVAAIFSLAALAKETAVVTPVALGLWELLLALRRGQPSEKKRRHVVWSICLMFPVVPLAGWYAYHYHKTGFIFGNPEFLRYNATANLNLYRILLCLYHRLLHLTMHMNMFVPVLCALAALLLPEIATRTRISKWALQAIAVILIANWVEFSVLGGALLTRYLLPMYPLVLLVCVAVWQKHVRRWEWLVALSAAAFLAGLWIDPPYAFAPEDNLTYRDMVVLHERAVSLIVKRWPEATVLTAWPANAELERPELGYTKKPVKAFTIQNFSIDEIMKAANEPEDYDTALLFSTKWVPPKHSLDFSRRNRSADTKYFDFHEDVSPEEAAAILHGQIVWNEHMGGEWAAVLRFPRIEDANLTK